MADSPADRARRSRRHRKGDHSLCKPESRCEAREQAGLLNTVSFAPPAQETPRKRGQAEPYGPRGRELREATTDMQFGPLHRVLLDEAARIADRLDRLDDALRNRGTWMRFEVDDGGEVVVHIDSVLAEARQQATALRGLVAELVKAAPVKPQDKPTAPVGGTLSQLADRIAAKQKRAGA